MLKLHCILDVQSTQKYQQLFPYSSIKLPMVYLIKVLMNFFKLFVIFFHQKTHFLSHCISTKKLLKTFDLGYEKIHACINDCCLFRKELGNAHMCPKCGASRWKVNERTEKIQQGVPAKVLRYFPIIPRLKRMFSATDMAEQLRWHQLIKVKMAK